MTDPQLTNIGANPLEQDDSKIKLHHMNNKGCPRVKHISNHQKCTAQTIQWITPAAKLDFSDAESYKICPHMNVHSKDMEIQTKI